MSKRFEGELRGGCGCDQEKEKERRERRQKKERRQRREKELRGGCGGFQEGGAFTPEARAKADAWRAELMDRFRAKKAVDPTFTLKEAMVELGEERKARGIMSTKATYIAKRKPGYVPREHKQRKLLTLPAAQKALIQYYRERLSSGAIKKPMMGLRRRSHAIEKEIGAKSGRGVVKAHKPLLHPCEADRFGLPIPTPECADSWKYRKTGPRDYRMMGLDTEGKNAPFYNMRTIRKIREGPRKLRASPVCREKVCSATKKDGTPCKNCAMKGQAVCFRHQ